MRSVSGIQENGISPKLSRSDASQVRQFIAAAIGMPDDELAKKIADHARKLKEPKQ
ncbi:hypothetical protein SAMN04244571_01769 [Azotobacter beijerinckii]|uniref:Uncharacterized protein n=2 Tax=Azotobacter beijerinckii TaxID=170623 RepID=A0A1I0Z3F5_9GAMM|nr:hypothetical protein SAMN04244571_01769 [Azotobacter beijerinckii]